MTTNGQARRRLDWTILADIGALLGAVCIGVGLWQLATPVLWIWGGAILLAGSIASVLPPKTPADSRPSLNNVIDK